MSVPSRAEVKATREGSADRENTEWVTANSKNNLEGRAAASNENVEKERRSARERAGTEIVWIHERINACINASQVT